MHWIKVRCRSWKAMSKQDHRNHLGRVLFNQVVPNEVGLRERAADQEGHCQHHRRGDQGAPTFRARPSSSTTSRTSASAGPSRAAFRFNLADIVRH
jgi:hypothetical protein